MKGASQLPAGYPAMMLLSLFPPVWFAVMNRRLPK
jgi:alkane 1-monooxygenase